MSRQPWFSIAALASVLLTSLAYGCSQTNSDSLGPAPTGPSTSTSTDGDGSAEDGGFIGPSSSGGGGLFSSDASFFGADVGAPPAGCTGLGCSVETNCPNKGHTVLKGTVFDPAGKNPIYDVVVFVPNDPNSLPKITPGTNTCNSCNTPIGDYVVVTQTDVNGNFTLTDVPSGSNLPLVVQIGKWRRIITVPSVPSCQTTTVASSGSGQARLPASHTEGDMPQMALLTGGLDNLGCFLRGIGIDDAEYGAPGSGGRLDIFQGIGGPALSGTGTPGNCQNANCPLWATKADLENYDIVLLACEGGTNPQTKPASALANMHDWLNEGGKVFATHFHYYWFSNSADPAFVATATWLGVSLGIGMPNGTIDTTFPKGMIFQQWLSQSAINVLTGPGGTIPLTGVATSVSTVNTATTSRWIYDNTTSPPDTKYLSFDTPIGGIVPPDGGTEGATPQYCGKAVFSDLHAGGAPTGSLPAACDPPAALTPQELALEFLFFDLSACVTDDSKPPPPPPPPQQPQ